MIHYHGTPISPIKDLLTMEGRHFCVSFYRPDDLNRCMQIGQSVMLDNGAFSAFTKGVPFDENAYYRWLEPILAPPHWAVVPDVIGGDEFQQFELMKRWPFRRDLGMPVWHLGLSTSYLLRLLDEWPRVCFGSSAEYWQIGSYSWCNRMDEAFNLIAQHHKTMPWIHGLRMLGQVGNRWPLASADSTNVAQNWKRDACCPESKARGIDAIQCPTTWKHRPVQAALL